MCIFPLFVCIFCDFGKVYSCILKIWCVFFRKFGNIFSKKYISYGMYFSISPKRNVDLCIFDMYFRIVFLNNVSVYIWYVFVVWAYGIYYDLNAIINWKILSARRRRNFLLLDVLRMYFLSIFIKLIHKIHIKAYVFCQYLLIVGYHICYLVCIFWDLVCIFCFFQTCILSKWKLRVY